MGGLSTPRLKSEIITLENQIKVINERNQDVTSYFVQGAKSALKIALEQKLIMQF